MTIKDLKPALVWNIFDQITKVPRPSKKEGKMREFLVDFAKKHNLECFVLLQEYTRLDTRGQT